MSDRSPSTVEYVVYRFEKAFKDGQQPSPDEYLQGEGVPRWRLMIELLHSELELRLRAGQDVRVRDYLTKYPDLLAFPNEVAALLETQLRQLHQRGVSPALADYEAEYPELGHRVREVFKRVGTAPPEVPGYEIVERLGQGGMGVVYRARQLQLNREVALKIIRPDRLHDDAPRADKFRSRFRQEAEAVAAVNHPSVVQIYETGECDGTLYLAMELIAGKSLQDRISKTGVLDPRAAAELFARVARAVHAVHERKIVHRDLKPDNILLTAAGEPKLSDFGLARPVEGPVGGTVAGDIIGTPEYMSPEQAALTGEEPTPAVDVYGLGATLYAALTGRPPFPRSSVL